VRAGDAGELLERAARGLERFAGVLAAPEARDCDERSDGSEDNAGAIVTPDTLARAQAQGLAAKALLADNDAYAFFSALGDLVVTGPTLTNVNDFRAILVDQS